MPVVLGGGELLREKRKEGEINEINIENRRVHKTKQKKKAKLPLSLSYDVLGYTEYKAHMYKHCPSPNHTLTSFT